MSVLRKLETSGASALHLADDMAGLGAITDPATAGAVWIRQRRPAFREWIDRLKPDHLPSGRLILRRAEVSEAVQGLFDKAQTPDSAERAWLQQDIVTLADMLADLMAAQYLRVRLDVVTTSACRRFHVDAIHSRLICTYRGTGTQYGVSTDGADPDRVFTVPTGAPIVLRGTNWPETPASGLRHRSPPIQGSGETRLLLVLDPVFDPDDAI